MAITKISNLPNILDSSSIIYNNIGRSGSPIPLVRGDLFETSLLAGITDARFNRYSASVRLEDLIYNVAGKIFKAPETGGTDLDSISPFAYNERYAKQYTNDDRLFFLMQDFTGTTRFSVIKACNVLDNQVVPAPTFGYNADGEVTGTVGFSDQKTGVNWVFDMDFFNRNPIPMLFPVFTQTKIYNSSWIEATPNFDINSGITYTGVHKILDDIVTMATDVTKIDIETILPKIALTPATKISESYPITLGENISDNISANSIDAGLSAQLIIADNSTIKVEATERSLISYTQYGYQSLSAYEETDKIYYGSAPWGPVCKSNPWVVVPQIVNPLPVGTGKLNLNLGNIAVFGSSTNTINTPISERQPTLTISELDEAGSYTVKIKGVDENIKFHRLAGNNNTNTSKGYRIEGYPANFNAEISTQDAAGTTLSSWNIVINTNETTTVDVGVASSIKIKVLSFVDTALNVAFDSQELPVFAIDSIDIDKTPVLPILSKANAYQGSESRYGITVVDARNDVVSAGYTGDLNDAIRNELKTLSTIYYGSPTRAIIPFYTLVGTEDTKQFILPYYPSVEALSTTKGVVKESLPNIRGAFPTGHIAPYAQFNTRGAFSLDYRNERSQSVGPEPQEWNLTRSNEPANVFNAGACHKSYIDGAGVQQITLNGFLYFYAGNVFDGQEDPTLSLEYISNKIEHREYELTSDTLEITTYSQNAEFDASDIGQMTPTDNHDNIFGITKIDLKIGEGSVLRFDDNKNLQLKIGTGLMVDDPTTNPKVSYEQDQSLAGQIQLPSAISSNTPVQVTDFSGINVYPDNGETKYSYSSKISLPWTYSIDGTSATTTVEFDAQGTTQDLLSSNTVANIILMGTITEANLLNAGINLGNISSTVAIGNTQIYEGQFSSTNMALNRLLVQVHISFDKSSTPGKIEITSVKISKAVEQSTASDLIAFVDDQWTVDYTGWLAVVHNLYRLYNTDYIFANSTIQALNSVIDDVKELKQLVGLANSQLYKTLYGPI